MPERLWSESADELLALLRRYHPLLAHVNWDGEDANTRCLVWYGSVYPDGQSGKPYAANAVLMVERQWDNLTPDAKLLQIATLAAQLLSRINAVDSLPDYHVGIETLRQWLPADAAAG